jgi:membrane-associated phospholipid phosphatase
VKPSDRDEFAFARGNAEGRSSFPSGHATVAFAFASAVSSELRADHARAARVMTPLLFGGATLVGAARLFDDKHWASDVAVGAGIGTVAGRVAVAYGRAHPHRRLERLAGALSIAPSAHGPGVGVRITTR